MARSKITNWSLNIDKLRVCLNITDETYNYLSETYTRLETKIDNNKEITIRHLDEDDFSLVFYDEDEKEMFASLIIPNCNNEKIKLGTFHFNNTKRYKNKAFFIFENSALYRPFTINTDGTRNSWIFALLYVADFYGMEFNNITELELAFDSDFNFVKKVRSLIKNVNKYDLYLNGRKVENNDEILKGYGEYYSRNRLKLQEPTLYFSQAKDTDLSMRMYNKGKELEENSPQKTNRYKEWNNWSNYDTIYRVEIVFHNTNVRDFFTRNINRLNDEINNHDNVLNLIGNEKIRMLMFLDACDRLIYFRDKKSKEKLSIIDLA